MDIALFSPSSLFHQEDDSSDEQTQDDHDDKSSSSYVQRSHQFPGMELVIREFSFHQMNANLLWPGTFAFVDCGTGALAIFLNKLYQVDITTSDYDDQEIEDNIAHNCTINGVSPVLPHIKQSDSWGDPFPIPCPEWDLIIASDILLQLWFSNLSSSIRLRLLLVTDVEANLEQHKIDQAAINSEAAAQRALLQETIEKNKVEADRQFAELMNAIKTQQPSTTAPPVTLPPPTRPMPTPIYSNFGGFTQPLIYQQPQHPTQTSAYTSFSGLHFDSQGFPLPMGSIGFGPFSTGEQGRNYNRGPPMSKEGAFPSFGELSLGNSEGVSSVNT
ncbi:hypothetical protein Tco_0815135 [Tanacetum coccineum]